MSICAVVCLVASVMSNSVTPWTLARQAPLSVGFSEQEYWSGFPCLPPGDLQDSEIEPASPVPSAMQVDFFFLPQPLGMPHIYIYMFIPVHTPQMVLVVKNPPANAGDMRDMGSIPGLGRCPGGGNGNPFQYFCLENPMDRRVAGYSP